MIRPADRPPFAAALLAGGRSTRMGRDKAGLVIDGVPLWQRQVAMLRALDPNELLISGRSDGPYVGADVEIVEDHTPGLGPLAGVAAVLRRVSASLVLVVAIDLLAMTSEFLASLVREGRALVPLDGDRFEPLAAVYPREALSIAEELLREEDRSLQRFVRRLVENGLLGVRAIEAAERPLFRNVNRPEDLD